MAIRSDLSDPPRRAPTSSAETTAEITIPGAQLRQDRIRAFASNPIAQSDADRERVLGPALSSKSLYIMQNHLMILTPPGSREATQLHRPSLASLERWSKLIHAAIKSNKEKIKGRSFVNFPVNLGHYCQEGKMALAALIRQILHYQ